VLMEVGEAALLGGHEPIVPSRPGAFDVPKACAWPG
jgi:hypothetical protein